MHGTSRPAETPIERPWQHPRHIIRGLLACTVTVTTVVAAQGPQLASGDRVRVTATHLGLDRVDGVLESIDGDTVLIATDTTLRMHRAAIDRIERHDGRKAYPVRAAGVGFLIGAGAGIVFGAALAQCPPAGCDTSPAVQGAVAGLAFGLAGAAIGGITGAVAKVDRWKTVPPDALRAGTGGAGAGTDVIR